MRVLRATVKSRFIADRARLPYGLQVNEVIDAVRKTYGLLYYINNFLLSRNVPRLEDLMLGNSFSGLLSEILVKNLSDCSGTLTRNLWVGGHPDLIRPGDYEGDSVLRAEEGVEVKTSRQKGGWQGHNPEDCWIIIFRYILGKPDDERQIFLPTEFVQILAAYITEDDWSFSGRSGTSRRTITASLTRGGVSKLRGNPIYQNAEYMVASSRQEREELIRIQRSLSGE
jgi:hypothetical protein